MRLTYFYYFFSPLLSSFTKLVFHFARFTLGSVGWYKFSINSKIRLNRYQTHGKSFRYLFRRRGKKMIANPNRRPIEILTLVSRCWITIDIDKNQMSRHKIRIELRIQLHFVTYGFFSTSSIWLNSILYVCVCMRLLGL